MAGKRRESSLSGGRVEPGAGGVPAQGPPRPSILVVTALCVLVAAGAAAVYAQTYRFGFVAYDDDLYVYHNGTVKQGLTRAGAEWAFTTFTCSNWHPLTWFSHMLDCRLFGANPGPMHLVNLGLHAANALMLLVAFTWMTGRPWRSAIVAGIFAVHPLHVESVAWIAERKDVLSAFLGLASLLFYIRYAGKPTVARYIPVAALFALALLAKPMLVTFPFVLLLIDVWPLGRLQWPLSYTTLARLVWEKAPLFAMTAAASIITFVAQQTTGAVAPLAGSAPSERVIRACIGCVSYLRRAFAPTGLAVFYPMQPVSAAEMAWALAVLAAVTLAAFAVRSRRPWLLVGWLWFLGMLVPVSGIVQVGTQASADRYTYLPLVGISFAVVWCVAEAVGGRRRLARAAAVVSCVALVILAAAAFRQARYWRSSQALFERAIAVTEGNYIMHNNLGVILMQESKYADAVAQYRIAESMNPNYEDAHGNLGHELLRAGVLDEARRELSAAVAIAPERAAFQADLAAVLVRQGDLAGAREHLEQAVKDAPDKPQYRANLDYVTQQLKETGARP